nr:helicase-related protein [Dietzia maris]
MGGQPLGEDRSGARGRGAGRFAADNLDALRVLTRLREEERTATEAEREVLRSWHAWGALPDIFEEDTARGREVRDLLDGQELNAARRTTINAHYTDPRIAAAVWGAVEGLGFDGGRVLEPGCGAGVFIDQAPRGVDLDLVGVELDPVTAEIAQHLHPEATIHNESFAESTFRDDSFDLTVGNVPFGDVRLHDPEHNRAHHSIHNHFIVKSLALTRPGGVVAVLTSRYTLDSVSDSARGEMHAMADLVGAVRLPSGAHRVSAGTEAVTDLLVLRRRLPGEPVRDGAWLTSAPAPDLGLTGGGSVSDYWRAHPENVLGVMDDEGHGMYGKQDIRVRNASLETVPEQLRERVGGIVDQARRDGLGFAGDRAVVAPGGRVEIPVMRVGDPALFAGHLSRAGEHGGWERVTRFGVEPVQVPASQELELRALVDMRDQVLRVLEMEGASRRDTPALTAERDELRRIYESYVRRYGPINRVKVTQTSRLDGDGNPIVTRRYPGAARTFREDPHSAVVRALEHYDELSGQAKPAAILSERVLAPSTRPERAETPADAMAICLDTRGEVDLEEVSSLLGVDAQTARTQLGSLVYDEPGTDRLIPAPEYLSGNIRRKIEAATAAAEADPRFLANVDALRAVLPRDLGPDEIAASIGAVWVPDTDVRAFMRETLRDPTVRVHHLGGSNWKVVQGLRNTPLATSEWGTDRMPAHEIIERLMRQQRIQVTDTMEDGTSVVNAVATEAAQAKAEALQEHFQEWIWRDPERTERLCKAYNEIFNSLVLRSYDAEGDRLSLPGLAVSFTPHPHQRAAVARMIGEPSVGLFHAVGAGKTAEMVMGCTELKRLGLVSKPAVIVPNHMLEQVTREWLQLYPAANILAAASEDLRGDGRAAFIAKAATGQWDAIVMTQTAFGAIPVSKQVERDYRDQEIARTREQMQKARDAGLSSQTVKSMEKAIVRQEERITKLLDRKRDAGLTWEQTGIDYLVVDELHLFKNLSIVSNIQDVAREGSQRATDLDMKIDLLRQAKGPSGRVVTGATATPIANTMAEAWVMQKYLRPDLLIDAGLTDFDSWATTFGRTVSKLEMRPAGDGFRMKDRFAAFQNLPELLQMWHVPADVKTPADLGLPVPALALTRDGERRAEIVSIPMSEGQRAFMKDLAGRSEAVRSRAVTPREDNMLKISGDGRKAGLDLRLLSDGVRPDVEVGLFDELTKVEVAADRIHAIWNETKHRFYGDSDRPGGLQIVFCDLGTPGDSWNVYDGLREALVERGMDPARVRYVHEAKNDEQKGRLFAACRGGDVDVIIGSTSKMGVGTNIQARAAALHHLDCPWRPADVEQREGRILRQGNLNEEVRILRYVTEGSFDAYMWQGVARKAAFIEQVMHGRVDQRTASDLDVEGEQFDYATVTAVASGNPLLLDRAEAQAEVEKLARLEGAHRRGQTYRLTLTRELTHRQEHLEHVIPVLEQAALAARSTKGEAFVAQVGGVSFTERTKAATAMHDRLVPEMVRLGRGVSEASIQDLVSLGGHTFDAHLKRSLDTDHVILTMRGTDGEVRMGAPLSDVLEGHGLVTRIENLVATLPARVGQEKQRLTQTIQELTDAQTGIGQPFPRGAELEEARGSLARIERELAGQTEPPDRVVGDQKAASGESTRVTGEPLRQFPSMPPKGTLAERVEALRGRHAEHAPMRDDTAPKRPRERSPRR